MDDRRWNELARLRDEVGAAVRLAGAPGVSDARFTGGDAAGAVTATVDGDGRVCAVTVARGWRGRVGPTGLSAAVRDAVRAATTARLGAWGSVAGIDNKTDADPAADLARRLAAATDGVTMDVARGREVLREILSMLTTIDESLDELSTELRPGAQPVFTGRSGAGHVTTRVDGSGTVVDVVLDQRWLRGAAETGIARELGEAFESAYRSAAAHSPRSLIAHSRLGALQRMATDPALLAQRLGLHGRRRSPADAGRA